MDMEDKVFQVMFHLVSGKTFSKNFGFDDETPNQECRDSIASQVKDLDYILNTDGNLATYYSCSHIESIEIKGPYTQEEHHARVNELNRKLEEEKAQLQQNREDWKNYFRK